MKEMDLLKRILATGWLDHELSCEVQELLAQPEVEPFIFKDRKLTGSLIVHDDMYKRGYAQAELDLKREPLSDEEIHAYLSLLEPPFLWDEGFCSGIEWAEKQHGIGGGN
jgi:hypothetical protein